MSMCAMRASSARRSPNWKVQLNRAPTMSTTSAPAMAVERAAPMHSPWSSGTVPRPMGEARKGMPRSTSRVSAGPASAQAAPLPIRISGRSALHSMSAMVATPAGSGCGRETVGSDMRSGAVSSGTRFAISSPGKSR